MARQSFRTPAHIQRINGEKHLLWANHDSTPRSHSAQASAWAAGQATLSRVSPLRNSTWIGSAIDAVGDLIVASNVGFDRHRLATPRLAQPAAHYVGVDLIGLRDGGH
jgi:hypothetical protein